MRGLGATGFNVHAQCHVVLGTDSNLASCTHIVLAAVVVVEGAPPVAGGHSPVGGRWAGSLPDSTPGAGERGQRSSQCGGAPYLGCWHGGGNHGDGLVPIGCQLVGGGWGCRLGGGGGEWKGRGKRIGEGERGEGRGEGEGEGGEERRGEGR